MFAEYRLRTGTLLAGLLMYPAFAIATPDLHIHVFDTEEKVKPDSAAPALALHVFSHTVGEDTEARQTQQIKQQPAQQNAALTYQHADVYLKTGYRRDELIWNKAGLNGVPNILSELTWDNLEIATLNIGSTLYFNNNWLVNLDFLYGRILDGDNQDSDYFGDNRTSEFSRSNNGADEGDVYDISAHIGYRWKWGYENSQSIKGEVRPLLGVSYHAQNLKAVDGNQTIPAFGAFEGLDSSYDSTWFGPWLGLESLFFFSDKLSLRLGTEAHYAYYDATANWNLRTDFEHPESFTHEAQGYGFITRLEAQYQFDTKLSFNFSVNHQRWRADRKGVDQIFFADGSTVKLKFNEVEWDSFAMNLGVNYQF